MESYSVYWSSCQKRTSSEGQFEEIAMMGKAVLGDAQYVTTACPSRVKQQERHRAGG